MKGGAFEIILASPEPADVTRHAGSLAGVCDVFVGWPSPYQSPLGRLLAVTGPLPSSVFSDRSPAGRRLVTRELAARPDVVVVDFPHAAVLLPEKVDSPSVMFTHNVETEIYERRAAVAKGLWKHIWQHEAAKMRAFEHKTLRRFDTVVAVSQRDARILRQRFRPAAIEEIDTGVDLDFYAFHPPPAHPARTVVFAGAMDSRSNIDGIRFLMDEVWPIVGAARPDARMAVVGRNPPATLVAEASKRGLPWRFTGFVDDMRPEVLAGDISVIPLRVGSGTRLKTFEAMALGRPVVSTTLGVEGLDVVPGRHCLVADSPEDLAGEIIRLLADAELRTRIAGAARELLEEQRFSWAAIGRQFESICQRTIGRRRSLVPIGATADRETLATS
jgi:glycosyltransferase involved in cell wall biosynthesis